MKPWEEFPFCCDIQSMKCPDPKDLLAIPFTRVLSFDVGQLSNRLSNLLA